MAVSVDRVYQKVLALANKEQRGYITPQEFNLFADMAQSEIFEQYFYDINQWTRQHGNEDAYADMRANLQEKLSLFEHTAIGDNVRVLNKWGDINLETSLPNLYRLGMVYVKYPENNGYVEADVVDNMKEFRLLSESKLTRHNRKRPVYHRYNNSYDRIKIYPYPVEDDGSDFDYSEQEFVNDFIQVQSIIHPGYYNTDGHYFYFDQADMIDLIGYTFTSLDVINVTVVRGSGTTIVHDSVDVMLFEASSSNSMNGHAHGRLEPNVSGTTVDFEVSDKIFLSTPKPVSKNRNVKVDYIKKPSQPNWSYIVVGDKALYNSSQSNDFDLHPSEESELVYRILVFAGISMEKPNLTQTAAALEQAKVQQEKS